MQKINIKSLLRMQKTGQTIRPLHIILGNRNLEKFGEIVNIPADSITYHPQFNAVDELSFNGIGQNKQVIAYRFITKDSIEEKIIRLQEDKRLLAETFITDSESIPTLTDQEWIGLLE